MSPDTPALPIPELLLASLGLNAPYVLDIYALYARNPETVSLPWRRYFEGLGKGDISPHEFPAAPPHGWEPAGNGGGGAPAVPGIPDAERRRGDGDAPVLEEDDTLVPLTGGSALIAANMEASRSVPTATSYRHVPVKVLEENRRFLNHYLDMAGEPKLSFTHLIAWAIVKSLARYPDLNDGFATVNGAPHRVRHAHVNLGIAVDLERRGGTRSLLVPVVAGADSLDFRTFVREMNRTVGAARSGVVDPGLYRGATITLTNPGTVGTESSVPRLMEGQGAIVAVGSIGHSAETRAMTPELLSRLGISKQMTISSTYDHRIVQGAASGEFLGGVERLLSGEDGFYDRIFRDMGVPYHPIRWTPDVSASQVGLEPAVFETLRHARVLQLINAYRVRGHLIANLDPLGGKPHYHPELDIQHYGLTLWDLDRPFLTGGRGEKGSAWHGAQAPLREILETLRGAYCGKIGVEYMYIQDPEQKQWIQERVEPAASREPLPVDVKQRVLAKLIDAEVFERFLHTKFVGHKRFSLEGGETVIPVLDALLEEAGKAGVEEVVMGMAHRGRLNVLAQTVGVDPGRIFAEFQGNRDPYVTQGSGDVKYHLGATGEHRTAAGTTVRLSLSPNPSHLEAVDPVVEGIARAKQERMGAEEGRRRVLPVLLHGDAAFAGQGVVAETLNLSQLRGYRTGGTVHVIVNNQIGFTTPVESARSSPYPTDVAKMCQAPVFHVNGDDPEGGVRALRWALAFRQRFQKDVVLDVVCYRRHGHNEGDEPSYTQPRLYAAIRNHPSPDAIYAARLVREGTVAAEEVEALRRAAQERLDAAFGRASSPEIALKPAPIASRHDESSRPRPTAVPRTVLERVTERILAVPEGLDVHPKLRKGMDARRDAMASGDGVDWAFAETLAWGSLVLEGVPVRLSGQDSVRGTFSQRHLLLYDDDTDTRWMGLQHLAADQAPFSAVDSPLSEEAVLGFEYGYTIGDPRTLVLWEAQFGDFANEAQVVIDQFLAGSRAKWGQPSGLVLLLPHGYEGQGPDHSSARLERFLQLAAEENLTVAYPTTPAQYFHLLRGQALGGMQTPLVVMTPKSLLRLPRAASRIDDLTAGEFHPVLGDPAPPDPGKAARVVFCSGKVFYDLEAAREKASRRTAALVRLERLYPFPVDQVRETLARYPGAEAVWAQEEPRNMGAWHAVADRFRSPELEERTLRYVGRPESASTATGYLGVHAEEQAQLAAEAVRP